MRNYKVTITCECNVKAESMEDAMRFANRLQNDLTMAATDVKVAQSLEIRNVEVRREWE